MKSSNALMVAILKGCAVGDAVGNSLEFRQRLAAEDFSEVLQRPVLSVTDDTQMTLFLSEKVAQGRHCAGSFVDALLDWYSTRTLVIRHDQFLRMRRAQFGEALSGLLQFESLFHGGVPGETCMTALREIEERGRRPRNDSKGCGTVMRAGPMAYYSIEREQFEANGVDWRALIDEQARITHDHPCAAMADRVLVSLIHAFFDNPQCDVRSAVEIVPRYGLVDADDEVLAHVRKALDAFHPHDIGAGWVAEEALAVAVWAVQEGEGDFVQTVRAAVLHDGNSDTTGAIAGVLAAARGSEIPESLYDRLIERDAIEYVIGLWGCNN